MPTRATSHTRPHRALLILLVVALLAAACSGDDDGAADEPEPDPGPDVTSTGGSKTISAGPLSVRLSQGEALAQEQGDPDPVVEGTPLDAAAVDAVFARLPEWVEPADDREDFNRPAETLPPPRTGDTIDAPFPAVGDDPPPEVPSGPLEVLRFQPEGEVAVAPSLSLTFDQPMVPLATLAQLDALDVPVTMTPELPGRWQWIGTTTLRFEHESDLIDRLPMATTYTVEVPAGTESETGGVLAETVSWQFETPTVNVRGISPSHDSLPLEPVFLATFDQRIDPADVLGVITLEAGGQEQAIRLATDNEIEGDAELRSTVGRQLDGRWLAFRAERAFEPDNAIVITVGPEIPSAEGPNTSSSSETFDARTYAPLKVVDQSCDSGDPCRPGRSLWMRFNNEIDTDAFDPATIEVDPELPGAYIFANGDSIEIRGATRGRTEYTVTLPAGLTDSFGQTLSADEDVEFSVRAAETQIEQFRQNLITLDPLADEPTIPVITTNHEELRLRVFDVDPSSDYPAYEEYQDFRWEIDRALPDWPVLVDTTIETGAGDDEVTETGIDLSAALDGAPGHVVVMVEATGQLANLTENDNRFWNNRPAVAWVQATEIGLDVYGDQDELLAWVTELSTGEPVEGVVVDLLGSQQTATSTSQGLARIDLPAPNSSNRHVTATLGDDVALLPTGTLTESLGRDDAIAHVFDDRGIYRPEETVHLKGWVRKFTRSSDAQLVLFDAGTSMTYSANDWYGNEIAKGSVDVNAAGGFDLEIDIPAGVNLGEAWIQFGLRKDGIDTGFGHSFQIQEFRRPEFEVTARAETPGPYLVDDPATVAVDAAYFAGGGLANADVEWNVTTRTASYSPPNWSDFTFGIWVPWWLDGDNYYNGYGFDGGPWPSPETSRETFSGVTDSSGTHYLRMDFDGDGEGQPTTVSAESTVFDVNRQAWSSSTDLLVHPGERYVGLRGTRTFVRKGEPLVIEAIVTDIDGNAAAGDSLTVEARRLEWRFTDGEWTEEAVETQTCDVTTGDEPVGCTFATDEGGKYTIVAEAVDADGRASRTELTRWVSGGTRVPARNIEQEEATLIPDRAEYAPGDTAEILVESPFSPAEGLLTVSRNGFVATETFRVDDFTAVLDVPIEDAHIPNLHVQVDLVGVTERTADDGTPLPDVADRPAFATGRLTLDVPPVARTLSVVAEPADPTLEPGVDTRVDVTVEDAAGDPVAGAELAVVVVDEAVLALTAYELGDPLASFYRPVASRVWSGYARSSIVLTDPEDLQRRRLDEREQDFDPAETAFAADASDDDSGDDMADGFASARAPAPNEQLALGGADPDPIDVRTNFDALAVYEPEVTTGADGTATIDVPLPDNLTRYRVMVVAVDGDDRFGSGESNITARLPLMVRPSPPRFLNFGDEFELPVVLQNQTSQDMEVDVAVQVANLELGEVVGQRVTVPADDRIEVRFPVAADSAGTARFRVAAVSGEHADAATLALPVYTPATTEAFATYGVVDDGAVIQPLLAPEGVYPQFGGLEVNTSSTALQALTDAVLYLHEYRYFSADGYASRILGVAALRDVLAAFEAEGLPDAAVLDANVAADIDALLRLQNGDGGFGWWQRGRPSEPFVSIQSIHALVMARDSGYTVSEEPYQRGLQYLRDIENRIPANYSQHTKDTLSAYALHVRLLAGDRDPGKAQRLYDRASDSLGLDAIAWLWPVVDSTATKAEILRLFQNRATETAGAATFATNYGEEAYLLLHSDRRSDGIILDALVREAPDSDLIPKVVAGLLGGQTRGRWNNVQENSFILLALNNYFDTFENVTPDFVARVWLGDLYAGEHEYRGRTTDRGLTEVPMADVIAEGDTDLIVSKDGPGRLYYRLGLRYAPDDLDLDPLDRGFVVSRSYEAIDDDGDVWRDDDGVWHVKAGADVRVRLFMVADSRRTHVALVDPLPAGLEAQNPELATTAELPPDEVFEEVFFEDDVAADVIAGDIGFRTSYWWGPWYEHQNLRDDRAEVFSSVLSAGTYDFTYVARATTPGTFVVPPTKAEEIYAPETFGRSASDVLIVEDVA